MLDTASAPWLMLLLAWLGGGNLLDSKATLITPNEPGEPMVIEGQVFDADGTTPLSGLKVYVYHACQDGDYHRTNQEPRLHATMITDPKGRFSFRSIRPGAYPGSGLAAHVHVELEGPGKSKRVTEFLFADDPKIPASSREIARRQGKFSMIVDLKKDAEGVWRGAWNLQWN